MMMGREKLFVLISNRQLTASNILELYGSRNNIETMFSDLKHRWIRGLSDALWKMS